MRRATSAAHRRLEAELDIDAAIAERPRMARLLGRFWGFHKVWEPAVLSALGDDGFGTPRLRSPLLEDDLLSLGLTSGEIADLPVCLDATPPPGRAGAIGSLYVLEGSTLGGRVINKRLKDAGWEGGLRYFDPYGESTGAAWRAFGLRAETCDDVEAMTASAARTFEVLRLWLTREGAR